MFSNEYQGGTHVEVLGTQGQNPLSAWKVSGPQKGVQKVYDKALKGYVFACGAGCKMALPRDDRSSLGLSQPNLLLQLEIGLGGPFSVEVGVTDSSGTRRRMILSSSFSELKSTPLHCQVPLSSVPRDSWLNLVLPLADLAAAVFRPGGGGGAGGLGGSGPLYRSLDSLHLAGTCRLRRICTLRDAPPLPQDGHEGQAMAPAKPLDFPPGLDCHTLLLDPRTLAFVSHSPTNGGGGGGGLGTSGLLGAGGGGVGGGGGGPGGGLGVVGTSTGAARSRPAALTLTHTSAGPGGGVVSLGAVGTGRNSNSGIGAARPHPHGAHSGFGSVSAQGHHSGPVGVVLASTGPAGAPGSSDEDDSGSGVAAAAGGLSGAPSGQLSGPLASLPEGSNLMGTLSGQSTPTGRHAPSAAPPSSWAISRGLSALGQGGPGTGGHGHSEHPPPSRLGRSPGSSLLSPNGASATAAAGGVSLLSLAPASGGRPPRSNTHGGASAGGASAGGAPSGTPGGPNSVNTAEDPTGGDASPFGGRRAVSAQTAVRYGPGSVLPGGDVSTAPSGPGVALGGAGAAGLGGAAAGAAGAAAGGSTLPRSPPWPRSVMSKRAQSGPARISTEALAQGLGETQAPDNMPMSPSLVPRHGRRAYNASNFPPTIVENEALSMSGGGAAPGSGGGSLVGSGGGGGSNAIPAVPPGLPRSPNRSPARHRLSQLGMGVTAREPQSPSLPTLRPVRTEASGGGARGGAEPPSPSVLLPNCGSPFAPLASVLTVRGGVDASIDFSQQHASGTYLNLRVGDLAADGAVMPCSPSFISTLSRHNSQRAHRYGGGGAGAGAGGGGGGGGGAFGSSAPGPSMDFSSDSDDGGGVQRSGASVGLGTGAAASGAAGSALEVPVAVPRIRTRLPAGASPVPGATSAGSAQRRNSSGPGTGTGSSNSGATTRRTADVDTPTRRAPGAGGGAGPVNAAAMSGRTSPATPNRVAPAGRAAGASGAVSKAGTAAGAASGGSTVTASSPARQRPTPPPGGRTGGGTGTQGRGRGGANANANVPDRLPPLAAGRGAPTGRGAGRGAAAAAAAGGAGGGGHGASSRARTTAGNEVDVEESITLTAGMWGGFGVDEDDDMLGSRHFRSPGGHGGGSDEERVGEMATGPSFGHNLAALAGGPEGSGDGMSPDRYGGGGGGGGWGGSGGAAGAALPPMGASGPSPPGTAMGGARGGGGGQSFFGGGAGGAAWPPRMQGLGGEDLPASPARYPAAAAGPLSPPIRRSGNRSGGSSEVPTPQHYQPTLTGHIAPLDNSPLQPHEGGGGGGGGAGGRETTFNGFAHFAPRRGSGDGGGLDSPRVSSPTAAPLPFDPLLDEEALLAGHHHAGGLLGAYGFGHLDPHDDPMAAAPEADGGGGGGATDWSKVGTGPTPPELLNPNRAFTPPVVPASKALGVALAPPPGRGGGAGGRGTGGGRGGRGAQVLKMAGGKEAAAAAPPPASRPVITPALGESMVDLVYDPVLNCYYDGSTGQYYELKT
ncbi:hypothetical protein HYH02_011588 [Chlamydomonas schloesseri]|uniref:CFA20 domain-containing protein n=1 Tax=Chlamydomonas schloesseri TaxID=2026947 RepID=A0A835W0H6_9CHLO|nr:hypothetical protein HYH02_011588 [Chlamydomonas schloesseri]|eukprot:KAG2436077.1 hypothetical protein HYH02_011588 [Chlamydomonas schloesseri]